MTRPGAYRLAQRQQQARITKCLPAKEKRNCGDATTLFGAGPHKWPRDSVFDCGWKVRKKLQETLSGSLASPPGHSYSSIVCLDFSCASAGNVGQAYSGRV